MALEEVNRYGILKWFHDQFNCYEKLRDNVSEFRVCLFVIML